MEISEKKLIGIGDLLRDSWDLYKKNWKRIFSVFFIPAILLIPTVFFDKFNGDTYVTKVSVLLFLTISLLTLIQLILNIIVSVGFISKSPSLEEADFKWQNVYKEGYKLLWPVALVGIFQLLALILPLILFIIPGAVLSIYFGFSIYALVIDNKKGIEALSFSFHLVKDRWLDVFFRTIILGVFVVVITWVVTSVFIIFSFIMPKNIADLLIITVSSFLQIAILTPFAILYSNNLYKSLKETAPYFIDDSRILYNKRIKTLIIIGCILPIMFVLGFLLMVLV